MWLILKLTLDSFLNSIVLDLRDVWRDATISKMFSSNVNCNNVPKKIVAMMKLLNCWIRERKQHMVWIFGLSKKGNSIWSKVLSLLFRRRQNVISFPMMWMSPHEYNIWSQHRYDCDISGMEFLSQLRCLGKIRA